MNSKRNSFEPRNWIPIVLGICALSGCAGTGLRPPSVITTPGVSDVEKVTASWPGDSWWQSFGTTELTEILRIAKVENRDISAATSRLLQAEALRRIAGATLFPQLEGAGSFRESGCTGQGCLNFGQGKTFALTLNGTYEVDLWGTGRNERRAAEARLSSARFARDHLALTIDANVARTFFGILATRERITIAYDNIHAMDRILAAIEVRSRAGTTSGLDRARQEAQIEIVRARVSQLQVQERIGVISLAVLLGRMPNDLEIQATNLNTVSIPAVPPELSSDLLLRRPDVAQAEADLASAHASLIAARTAFLPKISISGSGGFASAVLGTLFQGGNTGFSYGAGLLQSIFDGGRRVGQKQLAEATKQEFLASYQSVVLNAYADAETAITELNHYTTAEDHLRKEIGAATRAFEISELQFAQGVADLLGVLQAQQTLFAAQDQLAQAVLASRLAVIHLYEALGGGWVRPSGSDKGSE